MYCNHTKFCKKFSMCQYYRETVIGYRMYMLKIVLSHKTNYKHTWESNPLWKSVEHSNIHDARGDDMTYCIKTYLSGWVTSQIRCKIGLMSHGKSLRHCLDDTFISILPRWTTYWNVIFSLRDSTARHLFA